MSSPCDSQSVCQIVTSKKLCRSTKTSFDHLVTAFTGHRIPLVICKGSEVNQVVSWPIKWGEVKGTVRILNIYIKLICCSLLFDGTAHKLWFQRWCGSLRQQRKYSLRCCECNQATAEVMVVDAEVGLEKCIQPLRWYVRSSRRHSSISGQQIYFLC